MTVTPVGTVSGTSDSAQLGLLSSAAGSSADITTSRQDGETFMQLMVAQLKYQDPMNPTDSTQFLTQQAMFTQLQSIQQIQDETAQLMSAQMAFGASAMIGKQVSWGNADGSTGSGVVSGATFTSSGPVLSIGDTQVPLTSVVGVGDSTGTTTTGSTTTGSTDSSTDSSTDTTTA